MKKLKVITFIIILTLFAGLFTISKKALADDDDNSNNQSQEVETETKTECETTGPYGQQKCTTKTKTKTKQEQSYIAQIIEQRTVREFDITATDTASPVFGSLTAVLSIFAILTALYFKKKQA